jgi:hypothetical protein
MTNRCEPPAEYVNQLGWHWLEIDGDPLIVRWDVWQGEGGWVFPQGYAGPYHAHHLGYTYVAPVEVPPEVMALLVPNEAKSLETQDLP